MAYGETQEIAGSKVQGLALRVIAERLEHGEAGPDLPRGRAPVPDGCWRPRRTPTPQAPGRENSHLQGRPRKLLDPVLERMMEALHRYEGTVNPVMGGDSRHGLARAEDSACARAGSKVLE